ncbi:class I SAM-dependent methyltransferase [Aeromicrobium sp.]|uniref:class I SAM-dependent methyltransferase n=1 Tax=Aeromicrobium sp. TaxID=1871063 RepID=UPI003C4D3A3A
MTTAETIGPVQAMDAAFAGRACQLIDLTGRPRPMAMRRWRGPVDDADRSLLLDRCQGRTIDVGCGPGRLIEGLAELDVPALGIDVSPEAVRQARRRGVLAIRRDVFAAVPGEGRWDCVLLADGNIGIGGHPERLLGRVGEIVRAGGRVVVELDADGTDVVHHRWRLRVGGRVTPVFDWAVVGLDAIERMAHATGFVVEDLTTSGERHAAVLRQAA